MNFFILTLAIIAALIAFVAVANILRVTFGQLNWANTWAFVAHLLYAAIGGTAALWLFSLSGVAG